MEGRGLIRQNIEILGLTGHTKLLRRDATRPGPIGNMKPFDLVFADPPYGKKLGERAVAAFLENGWFAPNSILVLEERKDSLPTQLPGFKQLEIRSMGETTIGIFQRITEVSETGSSQ